MAGGDDDLLVFPGRGGPRANSGGKRPGAGRPKGSKNQPPPPPEVKERHNSAVLAMQEAKAKRESFLAHLAELEFQREAAKLVSAADVEQAAYRQGRMLQRNLVELLPARIVNDLMAITDPGAMETFLQEQIRAELENVILALTSASDAA